MKSVMTHQFSQVPSANIPRSSFDRSHGVKTAFDSGFLVPILVDEALPGDTFNLNLTAFARLATPIKPIMDNLHMETFFFAIPYRLVWQNWQKFNGEQTDPGDSTDFLIPTITSLPGGYDIESLSDYMGIPTGVGSLEHSALWHRAYNLVWNEWFRDENLQSSLPVPKLDGPDDPTIYDLVRRGKRHDYFTSCLPWPQKSDSGSVTIPLGTSAPIYGDKMQFDDVQDDTNSAQVLDAPGGVLKSLLGGASASRIYGASNASGDGQLLVDLTDATAATINQLRQAFQIQKMFERDARGGTRYTEIIRAHFSVISPDARLQRPEFLGGGTTMVNINPVEQNTQDVDGAGEQTPQGNLAAYGTAGLTGHGFTKSFTEHCLILGLVNVRADLNYQTSLNRMWSRQTRFDHYWPALSHIGEQAVLNKEIHAVGDATDDDVFGYQERFAEYRYKPSMITGIFRSQAMESLDIWHLAQDFQTTPVLGPAFIEDTPPVNRILAVQDEPEFLFDGYFSMRCARPMPLYGVPGLIDHF